MKKFLLIPSLFFLAESAFAVDLTNSAPDLASSQGTGGAGAVTNWVQNFYQFSIIAGVFLAVGVIAWAGLKYALAAGNPSGQSDARDQILQALLGLILLFGAYLILFTINPNLVELKLPDLKSVSVAPANVTGPREVDLPPDLRAEIDPSATVISTMQYGSETSANENRSVVAGRCANETNGKGVVVPKTPSGGGNIYYVCICTRCGVGDIGTGGV